MVAVERWDWQFSVNLSSYRHYFPTPSSPRIIGGSPKVGVWLQKPLTLALVGLKLVEGWKGASSPLSAASAALGRVHLRGLIDQSPS